MLEKLEPIGNAALVAHEGESALFLSLVGVCLFRRYFRSVGNALAHDHVREEGVRASAWQAVSSTSSVTSDKRVD